VSPCGTLDAISEVEGGGEIRPDHGRCGRWRRESLSTPSVREREVGSAFDAVVEGEGGGISP